MSGSLVAFVGKAPLKVRLFSGVCGKSAAKDPKDACAAIAGESYTLWLENEDRTDDITIIIIQIKALWIPVVGWWCHR
ncbi:hypothetical protein Goari_003109 [Gossypium aridum]|uniref:Uncharacterized protein n=1 Tax=Gossypium aridum TaxID=34290 RepID=A0A7J8YAJ7_GOSAI|nr:hypothetical protein [Gossypium aridum]